MCEVRTGLRDADARWLDASLEPIEFVQPGPETALLAGAWRATARREGSSCLFPMPSSRPLPTLWTQRS